MGALKFKLDGNKVKIKHQETEREFNLEDFKRIVTVYLEYYREGTTDLNPLVKEYPENKDEYESPPQNKWSR